MPVSPDDFRDAMRFWATGVAVFSASYEGIPHGMTVSSFTSISLEPPMVLASIQKSSRTHQTAENSGFFGVTILSQDQSEISDRFAGRLGEEQARFERVETFTLTSDSPLLRGGLAAFDCRIVHRVDLGAQTVFIGEVINSAVLSSERPLTYFDRAYRVLQE